MTFEPIRHVISDTQGSLRNHIPDKWLVLTFYRREGRFINKPLTSHAE